MTLIRQIILLQFLFSFAFSAKAQGKVMLSKQQALEDFKWLRFSLEYVHPRLYKYEEKSVVDARFDSLQNLVGSKVSGLDFLALVSKANAAVHCGHLYTIPKNQLAQEVLDKKVMPFHIKVLDEKIYAVNNCNPSIQNGSQILSINGRSSQDHAPVIALGKSTFTNNAADPYP